MLDKCPICGEPRLRFSSGVNRFACGTIGPYIKDGEEEYDTGHTCDIHTYSRLFTQMEKERGELQQRLAAAEAARDIAEKQLALICEGVNRRCGADNHQLPLVSLDRRLKQLAERLAAATAAARFYARYYDGPAESLLGEEDRKAFQWVELNRGEP